MNITHRYRIEPGRSVDLREFAPDDISGFAGSKDEAKHKLVELNRELDRLQELLYADRRYKVLIVLQAMDTGGKDGTIRSVFEGVNPQGVKVACFKAPTPLELDHDFLWRVHQHVPGRGELVVFNRSHYEDVLIVRVHKLVGKKVWSQRYEHINAFERLLADEGTVIRKLFLHISPAEQKRRLQDRLDEPGKRWKFDPADLDERRAWHRYMAAYEDALSKTSTECAPWYVVPADHKWYRNLVVASIVVETLSGLDMRYPKPGLDLASLKVE